MNFQSLVLIISLFVLSAMAIAIPQFKVLQNLVRRSKSTDTLSAEFPGSTRRPLQPDMTPAHMYQPSGHVVHGADHYEKLVSLCEAGFVSSCRSVTEESDRSRRQL